jgi:transcriptional regulator with XRE-family HTH domain
VTCIAIYHPLGQCAPMLGKRIGEAIKAARKAKGWSLEKLAAKIVPPTTYQHMSRLEKGGPALNIEWVERIARALQIDPMELLAPGFNDRQPTRFLLDEQVANEIARTLAEVALGGAEPENGTVQAIALLLLELNATFAEHPQVAADPQAVKPLLTLVSRRYGPAAS